MATHSGILARKIPWTEEPGGQQFMGPQRVGHNGATSTFRTKNNFFSIFKVGSLKGHFSPPLKIKLK